MPINNVSPRKVQESVHRGFERLKNFRNARIMFLRNYVGPYYDKTNGEIGSEALNMIFNAIRTLVPHIVMNFPVNKVNTRYLAYRDYSELLGLELDQNGKEIDIRGTYRRVIVDAIFTLGIMKTTLAQSDSILTIDEYDNIDPGMVVTDAVDFDNLVVDPRSEDHLFRDAAFIGDRITVSRQMLLDSGLYKNDLVERLPRAGGSTKNDRARDISMRNNKQEEDAEFEDDVEVVELWVPSANAIVTVPGTDETTFDDYLRVDDAFCPKEGPYTFLALTPPVPGNPLPVPAVGIWNDLHVLANRMAKKIAEQAERQKDILAYRRAGADDAEEIKNAGDGDTIAVDDPQNLNVMSFGGQKNTNEIQLSQLHQWFNMMAANPEQLGGQQVNASSATAATILQNNASIGLEDMKDLVYQAAAKEARNRAWFIHTDPMRETPLSRRKMIPAQWIVGAGGPMMVQPPQVMEEQIILTPEARRGDFMDFIFEIEPESMGRKDSKTRFAQGLDFVTKVIPAVFTAAQASAAMGVPFSPQACITRFAKIAGIDWMEECFFDPDFQVQIAMMLAAGPQPGPSKGQQGSGGPAPQSSMMDQIMQNGQPANLPYNASPQEQQMAGFQQGAVPGQQMVKQQFGGY